MTKKRILVLGNKESTREILEILSQIQTGIQIARADYDEKSEKAIEWHHPDLVLLDTDQRERDSPLISPSVSKALEKKRAKVAVVSSRTDPEAPLEARRLNAAGYILKPYNVRELIAHVNTLLQGKKRIACIGGGTGLFTLLSGLKKLPNVFLTSIVSMSDDGGSSGRLRSTFGILPPGDIRRSLVALSNAPELMNRVIQYRFQKGRELENHSFGNLFLAALSEIKGSMSEAVRALGDILNIQGIVLPVTTTMTDLVAKFEDGTVVRGESKIDLAEGRHPELRVTELWHEPEPVCNPDAYASILYADLVIIGPGDLFTSIVANLLIPGIRDALERTAARKIYVCNVMTKPGETTHYSAYDHVHEMAKYLGGDYLDYILISNTEFSSRGLAEYAKLGQKPVPASGIAEIQKITRAQIVVADLGHEEELVRHDSEKLKNQIEKLLEVKTLKVPA